MKLISIKQIHLSLHKILNEHILKILIQIFKNILKNNQKIIINLNYRNEQVTFIKIL